MTNCIHCDIAERYSNPDTKINNTYDILWVKPHAASRDIRPIWSNARRLIRMES